MNGEALETRGAAAARAMAPQRQSGPPSLQPPGGFARRAFEMQGAGCRGPVIPVRSPATWHATCAQRS
jgi:hypothetical protein